MRGTLKMALLAGTALGCSAAQAQFTMNNSVPGSFTEIRTNPSATLLTPSNIDDGTASFVCSVTNALITTAGTTLYASTNGNISNQATFTGYANTALPVTGPGLLLANYWDDLYDNPANGSGIYSLSTTEGGFPVHIIEWSQVQLFPGTVGSFQATFEVKIWGSGAPAIVQYLYQDMSGFGNGGSATVGVQWGPAAPNFYQYSLNTAGSVPNSAVLSVVAAGPAACCMPDGTCTTQTGAACASAGGSYQSGQTCGTVTCPQPGACCSPGGTCTFVQAAACTAGGGTFQGAGVTCASITCPIQYTVDDGTAENSIGLTAGGDICAANRFTSTAGADQITHVRIAFGTPPSINGLPVTAYIWSDPNGDGSPADATVLAQVPGVVSGATNFPIPALTFVDFDIPDTTIPVGQNFFVGFVMTQSAGQFPCALDQTTPHAQSWIGYATTPGTFNPNAWTNVFTTEAIGFAGNWTIRADAQASNPNATGACCLTNGTCVPAITQASCTAQGGAWAGANVTCGTANCQPQGACCSPNLTCSLATAAACSAAGGTFRGPGTNCSTPCPQPANTWVETGGDAGALPASAQVTQGTDPLNTILGTTSANDPQDMFQIRVCDVANFSAAACGSSFDTQLWLFSSSGMGVVANDDTCGLQSTINGSTGCLSAATPGLYYLAISGYDCDPSSAGGLIFDTNTTFAAIVCPTGPGAGQPVSTWGATGGTGSYTIALTGACFAQPAGNTCYANCDSSTTPPVANVADFTCFLQKFAALDSYANCDGSTTPPVINVADFTCFLQKFAAGCP